MSAENTAIQVSENIVQPFQWAWEGLRRNRRYKERSELIAKSVSETDITLFLEKDRPHPGLLEIDAELWGNEQQLEFGLKYWLPIETPKDKVGLGHWDKRLIGYGAEPMLHIPAVGKISWLKKICIGIEKNYLHRFHPEETIKVSIIGGHIDREHQKVVVLDNRRPKEYQLEEIGRILDDMGCVHKKSGKRPFYGDIGEWMRLYDYVFEDHLREPEVIDKMWDVTEEKIEARASRLPQKEASKLIEKTANRAFNKRYEDYLRKAEIFTNNRPNHPDRKDSDYTYLDLLRFQEAE